MSDLSVTNILSIYSQPQVLCVCVGGCGYDNGYGATQYLHINYYTIPPYSTHKLEGKVWHGDEYINQDKCR